MTINLFQTPEYKTLMHTHILQTIEYLFSKNQESFSSEIMQLLESIGNQLGVAIENAHFYQRIEEVIIGTTLLERHFEQWPVWSGKKDTGTA